MKEWDLLDTLSRTVKIFMDEGKAKTLWEAKKMLESYRLEVIVGPDVARSPTLQAALLTMVNTARRCFLGGVNVIGCVDYDLLIPWRNYRRLTDAILDLKGHLAEETTTSAPQIALGDASLQSTSPCQLRATFNGWSGGVIPIEEDVRLPEDQECVPAGILAGALAVSEAFQFIRGDTALAGRRPVGLSLWQPDAAVSWLTGRDEGPPIERLPTELWLIGLGHLGQAFLWTLGFLPYAHPEEVCLVLQDFDALTPANESTSPLTSRDLLGQKKTRTMARWCEERGFRTRINERLFADNFQVAPDEPSVALCGVDNAQARAALEEVGFKRVIEAGLGKGPQEYLAFQIHTFPAQQSARHRWGNNAGIPVANPAHQPSYRTLAKEGMDQCGVTMLAGRSVGASFVGTAVSALVIAEAIRMAMGEHRYALIDGSLRSLDPRQAVLAENRGPFNPGVTKAAFYDHAQPLRSSLYNESDWT